MHHSYWTLIAAIVANLVAQGLKPFYSFLTTRKWDPLLMFSSGGFPSSHSSMVSAVTLIIGLEEGFDSSIFTVAFIVMLIIIYDAANVRYYAGKNIQITQQLIQDIQELTQTRLSDPIYSSKVKQVLGHRWIEVFGGIAHGLIIGGLIYYLFLL